MTLSPSFLYNFFFLGNYCRIPDVYRNENLFNVERNKCRAVLYGAAKGGKICVARWAVSQWGIEALREVSRTVTVYIRMVIEAFLTSLPLW